MRCCLERCSDSALQQCAGAFVRAKHPTPMHALEHQYQMSLAHQYAERAFQSRLSQTVWARKPGHSKMLGRYILILDITLSMHT